jgi:hypothetical protein
MMQVRPSSATGEGVDALCVPRRKGVDRKQAVVVLLWDGPLLVCAGRMSVVVVSQFGTGW